MTYEDSDVDYLIWSGQCRRAERGENRTLRCLYDLMDKALENERVFFISNNYDHSGYAQDLFLDTFFDEYTLTYTPGKVELWNETNYHCTIIFTIVNAFNIRGMTNFNFVLDHNWNEVEQWDWKQGRDNEDKILEARKRVRMNRAIKCVKGK